MNTNAAGQGPVLSEGLGAWRPIATAPRDGTPVLVWGEFAGEINGPMGVECVGVAAWRGGRTDYPGYEWHAENTDAYSGWWKATHWMPQPAGPQESA